MPPGRRKSWRLALRPACVGRTRRGAGGGGPFAQQDPKGDPESPSYPMGTIPWGSSCILPILPG